MQLFFFGSCIPIPDMECIPRTKASLWGGGGLLCLTSDLSVKREVAQQFTTACQRRKRSVRGCRGAAWGRAQPPAA